MDGKNLFWIILFSSVLQKTKAAPLRSRIRQYQPCLKCGIGQGVVSLCNGTQETLCELCPSGKFSDHPSAMAPCLSCSSCGDGLFALYPCTAESDTFCELCSWTDATTNEDYKKKCPGFLKQVREYSEPEETKDAIWKKWNKNDIPFGDDPDALTDNGAVEEHPLGEDFDGTVDKKDPTSVVTPTVAAPGEGQKGTVDGNSKHNGDKLHGTGEVAHDDLGHDVNTESLEPAVGEENEEELGDETNSTAASIDGDNEELLSKDDLITWTAASTRAAEQEGDVEEESSGVDEEDEKKIGRKQIEIPSLEGSGDDLPKGSMEDTTKYSPPVPSISTPAPTSITSESPSSTESSDEDRQGDGDHDDDDDDDDDDDGDDDDDVSLEGEDDTTGRPFFGQRKKGKMEVPVVGIIVAIVTVGIVFFAAGFFFNRFGRKRGWCGSPQQGEYHPAAQTEPNNYKEMVELSNTPRRSILVKPTVATVTHSSNVNTFKPNDNDDIKMADEEEDQVDNEKENLSVTKETPEKSQSPIDINSDDVEFDDILEKNALVIKYIPKNTRTITNTGQTIEVTVDGQDSILGGGPLGDKKYQLNTFHFHWGSVSSRGSEHTVKGKRYAGEVHLVHWNQEDYASFSEAAKSEDGLAILSVFLKVGSKEDSSIQIISDCLPSIQFKGESRDLPINNFDPARLLPNNTSEYWSYTGSMTMPPFAETVTWIIFKNPLEITESQIKNFRQLLSYERDEGHDKTGKTDAYLLNNYKPTVPLGDRPLRASFL